MVMTGGGRGFQAGSYFLKEEHVRKSPDLIQNQQQHKMHSLIHSCYGNRSLGGVLRASGWDSCLWVLLRAPCPKGVTRRSHGGRTAGLLESKEGAATRTHSRREEPQKRSLNQAEMLLLAFPRAPARTYPRGNRRDPRRRGPSLSRTSMHQRGNHHCTWGERQQLQPQPSHLGTGRGMEPAWHG